jgi:hypothetical protein
MIEGYMADNMICPGLSMGDSAAMAGRLDQGSC